MTTKPDPTRITSITPETEKVSIRLDENLQAELEYEDYDYAGVSEPRVEKIGEGARVCKSFIVNGIDLLAELPDDADYKLIYAPNAKSLSLDGEQSDSIEFHFNPRINAVIFARLETVEDFLSILHEIGHSKERIDPDIALQAVAIVRSVTRRKLYGNRLVTSEDIRRSESIIGMNYYTGKKIVSDSERFASESAIKILEKYPQLDDSLLHKAQQFYEDHWRSYDFHLIPYATTSDLAKEGFDNREVLKLYAAHEHLIDTVVDSFELMALGDRKEYSWYDDGVLYHVKIDDDGKFIFSKHNGEHGESIFVDNMGLSVFDSRKGKYVLNVKFSSSSKGLTDDAIDMTKDRLNEAYEAVISALRNRSANAKRIVDSIYESEKPIDLLKNYNLLKLNGGVELPEENPVDNMKSIDVPRYGEKLSRRLASVYTIEVLGESYSDDRFNMYTGEPINDGFDLFKGTLMRCYFEALNSVAQSDIPFERDSNLLTIPYMLRIVNAYIDYLEKNRNY